MNPDFSVLTPTLNQGRFIEATIMSVRGQAHSSFEHIVIDGGSTDDTLSILQRYESRYPLRWLSEPDRGMYDAINKGIGLANGRYLAYLNSDDLYLPWTLHVVASAFAAEPDVDVIYGDAIRLDEHGRTIPWFQAGFDAGAGSAWGSLIQPAVFWRRRVVDQIGSFDASLRFVGDLDFWLRAAKRHRFRRVDEFLAIDRSHPDAASRALADRMAIEDRRVRGAYRDGLWSLPSAGTLSRLRSSTLRRILWLRFVAATRQSTSDVGPWARTRMATAPRVESADAILGLVPGLAVGRLAATRWSTEPYTVANGGDAALA